MEGEEHKNDTEEQTVKIPLRDKITVRKLEDISSRMLEPVVEEQKAIDTRRVIRAIKDPNLVIKGTKQQMFLFDEEMAPQPGSKSQADKVAKESMHSLYRMPGTDIKLSPEQIEHIGFLECMSGPRFPHMDETESDTTFERLSDDDESDETPSLLELLKSDIEEEKTDENSIKDLRESKKSSVQFSEEINKEKQEDSKPEKKKPKLKRWKPQLKQNPMTPDPIITEYVEGVTKYLKEIGIFSFMKDWLYHLYGTNPKPKEPVKQLRKYIEESFGDSEQESGVSQLEKELRVILKKEDEMIVEISKLKHLAHLLAPEIYDADGNMISHEPSVEEEQFVVEEESVQAPTLEKVDESPSHMKLRKGSIKNKSTVKKAKGLKQGAQEIPRVQSKMSRKEKLAKKKKTSRKFSKPKLK